MKKSLSKGVTWTAWMSMRQQGSPPPVRKLP